jgi:tetratricopeptide (TPR) repeat protein
VAVVFVGAVVMGLPTIGGGFVGGDDHRLALNHVLVNRPSLEHAIKLFTTPHRDLYQPLPLLSFSAEFAIADALGLFDHSVSGGTWLFHLTNVLLHALNAVLVWFVIRSLHERAGTAWADTAAGSSLQLKSWDRSGTAPAVATVGALLFALHPIQVEVVAWTNGRMMLMSTLFALLSVLTFARWLDRPRPSSAVLTGLSVLLSALSKVRIGLPILLALVAPARRAKFGARFLWLWLVCGLVTGIFVLVNVWATADVDLFAEAAEHLHGPRLVRVILALGCYAQHLVWPVGLGSYYPTPPLVAWSDAGTWRAIVIVVPALVFLVWTCWRSRVARLGWLWFFATLWVTLPFVPARNILAADRYLYLPIVGLVWLLATLGVHAYGRLQQRTSSQFARIAATVVVAALAPLSVGMSWHVGRTYATPLSKTMRTAELFPDTPRVWERLGWTLYSNGDCEQAIECARKELRHDAPAVQAGAYQLMGMAEVRCGDAEEGLALLHKAIEVNPENPLGHYRLAMAYDELGRFDEAIPHYRAVTELAPLHNPSFDRLGQLYRLSGRHAEARATFEKALANNQYEVRAIMGMVELDVDEGTPAALASAERRLTDLLSWMDDNVDAWTNLGAVREALGRSDAAVDAYTRALERDPDHVLALINLAQIHYANGDVERAWPLFVRAAQAGVTSLAEAVVVHDVFVAQDTLDRAVALWEDFVERFPASAQGRAFLTWSRALAGDLVRARAETDTVTEENPESSALSRATLAFVALAQGRYTDAVAQAETLCDMGQQGDEARHRLLGALERFDRQTPDVPWTFCLTTRLLIANGQLDAAGVFLELAVERCGDAACQEHIQRLGSLLGEAAGTSGVSDPP